MLMKILILAVMILWLVASLPQTRFIWVPDIYGQGSFDWVAANLRAVIIDFLPLVVVFVESQLLARHTDKAKRSFNRKDNKDELDFDVWQQSYPTTERSVAKQMPRLFIASTLVISVSYWAYYTEFGRELALYDIKYIGGIIEFLVLVVYLTISALFTYGWGKLMSAFEVNTVLEDFAKFGQTLFKQKPRKRVIEKPSVPKPKKRKKIPAKKRRAELFERLCQDVSQRTEDLAKEFGVSDQTIRNDYRYLEQEGKIKYDRGKISIVEQEGDF